MADFPIILPAGAQLNQITSLDAHRTDPDAHPNYVHKDEFGADLTAEVKRHNLDSKAHPDIRTYVENRFNQHINSADPHPEYEQKFRQVVYTHNSDPNAHDVITGEIKKMLDMHVHASLPHSEYDSFLLDRLAAHNNSTESHRALKSVIDETIQNHIDDAEAHKAIFDKLTEKIGEDIGGHKADELAHAVHYIRRDELTDSILDYEKNKAINLSDDSENYTKTDPEQAEEGEGIKAHVITAFVLNQILKEYGLNDVKDKDYLPKGMIVRSDEQVPDISSPDYESYVPSLDLFLKYRKIAVDAKELAEDLKNKIENGDIGGGGSSGGSGDGGETPSTPTTNPNPSTTGRAVYPSNPKGEYGNDFMVRMNLIAKYKSPFTNTAAAGSATASKIVEGIRTDTFYADPPPVEDDLDLTNFECIPYLVASHEGFTIRTQRAKVSLVVKGVDGSTTTSEYSLRDIVSVVKTSDSTTIYVRMYNSIEIEAGIEQNIPGLTSVPLDWYLDIHLRRIA